VIALEEIRALMGPEAPPNDAELEKLRATLYWQADLILDMARARRRSRTGRSDEGGRLLPRLV
jgi:hypothetical protein